MPEKVRYSNLIERFYNAKLKTTRNRVTIIHKSFGMPAVSLKDTN